MVYEVTVPANTTATVTLPNAAADGIKMNTQAMPESVKSGMKISGKNLLLNIGSGTYSFSYTMN
jgi:alpha-L-rhamnosidase